MAWFLTTEYKNRETGEDWAPALVAMPAEVERFRAIRVQLGKDIEARCMAGSADPTSVDYPWFGPSELPSLLEGWRFPMPDRPFTARLKERQGSLVDIINSGLGTWAISRRVIDMIEAIEPGVHQYLPFQLLQPDGSVHGDQRWMLNVCARAEVVDVEKSNVQWMAPPLNFRFMNAPGERRLIVKAAEAAKRAFWYEWRYHNAQGTFTSDALWAALQSAGVRGWEPHFAFPHHIEEV